MQERVEWFTRADVDGSDSTVCKRARSVRPTVIAGLVPSALSAIVDQLQRKRGPIGDATVARPVKNLESVPFSWVSFAP